MFRTLFRYIYGLDQESIELIEAKRYRPKEFIQIPMEIPMEIPSISIDRLSSDELHEAVIKILKDLK